MKFKKIVGFGDSWMWGDELLDPTLESHPRAHPVLFENTTYRESNCFLGLLGQHYGALTENFGIPGGSSQSAIWTFLWWLKNEPDPESCLVLVGHTNSYRVSHYNPNHISYANDPPWNRFVHSTWTGESAFTTLIKEQTVLTHCKELSILNYTQAVLLFDGVAARQNLKLFQFNIARSEHPITNVPTLFYPDFSFMHWFVQELQPVHGRKYIKPNGHPNELGHRLIADHLINQIDSCIM